MDKDDKQGDIGLTNNSVQVEYARALENARTGNSIHSSITGNSSASGASPSGTTPGAAAPIIGAAGTPSTGAGNGSNGNPPPPAGGGSGGSGGFGKWLNNLGVLGRLFFGLSAFLIFIYAANMLLYYFQILTNKNLEETVRIMGIIEENKRKQQESQVPTAVGPTVVTTPSVVAPQSNPVPPVVNHEVKQTVTMYPKTFSCLTQEEMWEGYAKGEVFQLNEGQSAKIGSGCILLQINTKVMKVSGSNYHLMAKIPGTLNDYYKRGNGLGGRNDSTAEVIRFMNDEHPNEQLYFSIANGGYVHIN